MSSSSVNLETYRIPLKEIIRATKNFSSETLVGDGGFGMVYRGQLSEQWENRSVAIKRLHPSGCQGNVEFYNELEMVRTFKHPNIIPFIGYCDDANEKIVVFEYATNESLDHHLQNPNKRRCLTWVQRLKICLGAAKGLKYLHSGVEEQRRVIHRDVKSANILLDDNLEAKICDFGLSRFSPRDQPDTRVFTRASGTRFYIDPIYNERGRLTKESDIYSFGVVMLELSSGTLAYDERRFKQYLIGVVRNNYEEYRVPGLDMLVDPFIRGRMYTSSFHQFNEIAYKCIDLDIRKRPTMDEIIEGIGEALNRQSFYIDKPIEWQHDSEKNMYLCGAKDLTIEWQFDTRYWNWGHIPISRFPEVCILKQVCLLEIRGTIAVVKLSQKSTYVACFVFQTTNDSEGLVTPAKTRVSIGGKEIIMENVYLKRPEHEQEDNYVFPNQRNDGWMEIKLGEFETNEGDDGEVEMAFKDVSGHWKKGLVVEGFEIRPK